VPDLMFDNVSEAVDFDIEYDALAAPAVKAIRDLIERNDAPVLVGVCGRSRAGKSVMAHAIIRALIEQGIPSLRVRLDDWIVPAIERGPNTSSEARNRVNVLPGLLEDLRSGVSVRAPGYDAATRGADEPTIYDPRGQSVIVLEGSFAGHQCIRAMLNLAIFMTVPAEVQRARFSAFYRWKGLAEHAIEGLWRERASEEWPTVDAQRSGADIVMNPGAHRS